MKTNVCAAIVFALALLICMSGCTYIKLQEQLTVDFTASVSYEGNADQETMDQFLNYYTYPHSKNQKPVMFTIHFSNQSHTDISNFILKDVQTDCVYIDPDFVFSEGPCRIESMKTKDVSVFAYVDENMTTQELNQWVKQQIFTYDLYPEIDGASITLEFYGDGTLVK